MVDRPHKPSALAATTEAPPQAQVNITHENQRVSATLPTGEQVDVLLFGATVLSWKDAAGDEKLWLSDAAKLDGSKPVRGGIPLVFPVFGKSSNHPATSNLPQHGFARNSKWEFLGKSTSEAAGSSSSVKLDFGLSSETLDETSKSAWPYKFGLLYSVTLEQESLNTTLVVTNDGDEPFECQTLLHTYLRINDINNAEIKGLDGSSFVDKMDGASTKTQSAGVKFTAETDRVYTTKAGTETPVEVLDGGKKRFRITRDNLDDVVVWNPWTEKAAGMGDFEPKDGWKNMVCVEAGSVSGFQKLDKGDAFEGAQTFWLS